MVKTGSRFKKRVGRMGIRRGLLAAVALSCFGAGGDAGAFQIPTGNDDIDIRWDNTFRYSLTQRAKGQNETLLSDHNIDDGNRNFASGIVGNRLDILSEFDLAYQKRFGVSLSATGWYDRAYHGRLDNRTASSSNHLVNGQPALGLSDYTDRYYAGPSGEILNAFAYGNFAIGDVPVNLKAGSHTIIWGESMFGSGGAQGISYAQSGVDAGKGLAMPGVEMKELFRPLNQISLQVQPADDLTVAGQYFLDWEATRLPGAGSYLGFADMIWTGGESLQTPPPPFGLGTLVNGGDINPKDRGDWGVSARWSPAWLEGTLGIYYRDLSAKEGQMHISPMAHKYNFAFASGVKLYGVSLSQQISGVSIGSEVNYRRNMPLQSDAAIIGPFPGATSAALPRAGQTLGARGDTIHAVVNTLKVISKTPFFDTAAFLTEFVWDHWLSVNQGAELFKGRDSYSGADRVTRDHVACQVVFSPTWYQVVTGVDLTMPLSASIGLSGTSAMIAETNNKDSGQYGIGLNADIFQRYKVDLTYVGYFGSFTRDVRGVHANSPYATLRDRNMVTLTLKTTF